MDLKVTKIGRDSKVTINLTGLNSLLAGVQQRLVTRVGVLGDSSRKTNPKNTYDVTNAQIGLAHEKGVASHNLPRRSWLEMPLEDKLGAYFVRLGPKVIQKIIEENQVKAYAELGIVAEQIIQDAFQTGGFGKWRPLKASTIRRKGSAAILIDTAQLRRSITSQVVTT